MSAGKVALVTGSATGVGRAVAVRFARRGFTVADDAQVRAMVERCRAELGGLDVLVNNAGMTHFIAHTDLEAGTDEVWDEIFQVNLKGAFYASRAAMPLLKDRSGCIVNVSSVAGLQGHGSSIPYSASKAALNCMTQSLARAFAPEVRVNAVAPGPILTRWLKGHEEHVDRAIAQTP